MKHMVEADSALYVLDSSGWIFIDGRPDRERILWHIMQLVEHGRIISPPEVWAELIRCHTVLAWIKEHRDKIVLSITDNDYFTIVGQIAFRFPLMCGTRGARDKGDGYVVAMATHLNRTTNRRHHVVAKETTVNNPNRKIPTACGVYNVECEGIVAMLRREFPDEAWEE